MTAIADAIREHRARGVGNAAALAKAVAEGENVPMDAIVESIAFGGMDDAAFEKLVNVCRERQRLRRLLAGRDEALAEVERLTGRIDLCDKALSEAVRKHREQVEPLISAKQAAENRYAEAGAADMQLRQAGLLPRPLHEARQDARRKLETLQGEVFKWEGTVKREAREISHYTAALAEAQGGAEGADARRRTAPGRMDRDEHALASRLQAAKLAHDEAVEMLAKLKPQLAKAEIEYAAAEKSCLEF
jgi:chromosome segregation ATPase